MIDKRKPPVCVLLLDMNETSSTSGYFNHSSPGPSDLSSDVTVSSSIISRSTESIQLDTEQLVSIETSMTIVGPVIVITGASAVATAQRYTLDVLFRHLASR